MPIGKNSISRVKNNGYTNIKNTAPDMENSKISEKKSAPVSKKLTSKSSTASKAPVKKNTSEASSKSSAKKPTANSQSKTVKKQASASATTAPKTETSKKKKNYVKIGEKMPIYLL